MSKSSYPLAGRVAALEQQLAEMDSRHMRHMLSLYQEHRRILLYLLAKKESSRKQPAKPGRIEVRGSCRIIQFKSKNAI